MVKKGSLYKNFGAFLTIITYIWLLKLFTIISPDPVKDSRKVFESSCSAFPFPGRFTFPN